MHQKQGINFLNAFNRILNAFTNMYTRHETWQCLKKCFFNNYVGFTNNKRQISIIFQILSQGLLYYGIMLDVY